MLTYRKWELGYKQNNEMGYTVLCTTVKETVLGGTISVDMQVSVQCGISASKSSKILMFISRNIAYKEKRLIIHMYD